MAIQPLAQLDAGDIAVGIDQYPPLRHFELQHPARPPRPRQCFVRAVKRGDDAVRQLRRRLVPDPLARRLHLPIGQPRRRAHHAALEAVSQQIAVAVDPQVRGKARAVLRRHQRAPAARQLVRQHRHDTIGEVDGIAAIQRRLVQRAARPHVVGDVRDRHQQPPAAAIAGIQVGLGPDGVVEVARVLAVDGDQRQLT